MRRSNKLYEEVRLDVVREAMSGIKVGVLARKYNLHPETNAILASISCTFAFK